MAPACHLRRVLLLLPLILPHPAPLLLLLLVIQVVPPLEDLAKEGHQLLVIVHLAVFLPYVLVQFAVAPDVFLLLSGATPAEPSPRSWTVVSCYSC